ncbi:MAG: sigma-70 family RNA polymerase sigma factor [bacterium]|nr:sigma-70 family RNA polymerase sigma factor [bacterium]
MPRTTADSAAELAARIEAADREAEQEMVERFGRGVALILRRTLADRAGAEDLFQETFHLALQKIRAGELREPHKLSGFLTGLARNLAIDHLRREAKHRAEAGPEALERLEHQSPTPLGSLLTREKASLIRRVLGELTTDRDRQILFRFYIAEEDKEEICEDLGLNSLHFNRVLHRARLRYRELYEKAVAES